MAYYNVPNYLKRVSVVVKLKDTGTGNKPRSNMSRSLHSLASFIRRLSSLLTVFCIQIIRTSISMNAKN